MPFEYQFPDPGTADSDGLLAGDPEVLLENRVASPADGVATPMAEATAASVASSPALAAGSSAIARRRLPAATSSCRD